PAWMTRNVREQPATIGICRDQFGHTPVECRDLRDEFAHPTAAGIYRTLASTDREIERDDAACSPIEMVVNLPQKLGRTRVRCGVTIENAAVRCMRDQARKLRPSADEFVRRNCCQNFLRSIHPFSGTSSSIVDYIHTRSLLSAFARYSA